MKPRCIPITCFFIKRHWNPGWLPKSFFLWRWILLTRRLRYLNVCFYLLRNSHSAGLGLTWISLWSVQTCTSWDKYMCWRVCSTTSMSSNKLYYRRSIKTLFIVTTLPYLTYVNYWRHDQIPLENILCYLITKVVNPTSIHWVRVNQ